MAEQKFASAELAQWVEQWRETRALTYDLLHVIPYALMNFAPYPDFGTFARQFRHIGDFQFCYVRGITSGTMDFSAQPRQRTLEQSKDALEGYLRDLDAELGGALASLTTGQLARPIVWGSTQISLGQHLMRLLQHETLHQGMWAIYAGVADLPLPPSWHKAWAFRSGLQEDSP